MNFYFRSLTILGVYELRITTNGNCLLIKITPNIDLDKYDIK